MEAELHDRFANDRLTGEWFKPTPEIHAYISEQAKPYAANDNNQAESQNGAVEN